MRDLSLRTIMGWLFALEAALFLPTAIWASMRGGQAHFSPGFHAASPPSFLSMELVVFAGASLSILKRWHSAPVWGIAASSLFVLLYLAPLVTPQQFVWWHGLGNLFLGLSGLIAFTRSSNSEAQ